MIAKNISEQVFENWCESKGLLVENVPRQSEKKLQTPDYVLEVANLRIVVEVKESNPDYEETEWEVGAKVRDQIKDGGKQIRARTGKKQPGMLVLYDQGQFSGHASPEDIQAAMYGPLKMHFALPSDSSKPPYVTGVSRGGGRKMTEDTNTSISAVAALWTPTPSEIRLDVYHNVFAAVPIHLGILAPYASEQKIYDPDHGCFVDYEP